nr:MAG TPA: hypothetical protein [Microviridae sp.]
MCCIGAWRGSPLGGGVCELLFGGSPSRGCSG